MRASRAGMELLHARASIQIRSRLFASALECVPRLAAGFGDAGCSLDSSLAATFDPANDRICWFHAARHGKSVEDTCHVS